MKLKTQESKLKMREVLCSLLDNGGSLRTIRDDDGHAVGYIVRKIRSVDKAASVAEADIYVSYVDSYRRASSASLTLAECRAFSIMHLDAFDKDWSKDKLHSVTFVDGRLEEADQTLLSIWAWEAAHEVISHCEAKKTGRSQSIYEGRSKGTGGLILRSFSELPKYFKDIKTIKVRFDRAF